MAPVLGPVRRPDRPGGAAPEPAREYAAWLACLADMAQVLTPASAYRERGQYVLGRYGPSQGLRDQCLRDQGLRATAP
jgi:hypothetical protein